MKFFDEAKIEVIAGDGAMMAFRRFVIARRVAP